MVLSLLFLFLHLSPTPLGGGREACSHRLSSNSNSMSHSFLSLGKSALFYLFFLVLFILFFMISFLYYFYYHVSLLYLPTPCNHHTVVHALLSFSFLLNPSITSPPLPAVLQSESVSVLLVSSAC